MAIVRAPMTREPMTRQQTPVERHLGFALLLACMLAIPARIYAVAIGKELFWDSAEAVVISWVEPEELRRNECTPIYEFHTPDGDTWSFTDEDSSICSLVRVGSKAPVLYDPADPDDTAIVTGFWRWSFLALCMVLGALAGFSVGIFLVPLVLWPIERLTGLRFGRLDDERKPHGLPG